jgi:Tfp pilus assembly protein PilF
MTAKEIDPNMAGVRSNLGLLLDSTVGPCDDSEKQFRLAVELDPNLAIAHDNLGVCLLARRKAKEALHEHEKALQLNPYNPISHMNRGNALQELGNINDAVEEYESALNLNPSIEAIYVNYGIALYKRGDVKGAIEKYRRALKIDNNMPLPHLKLAEATKTSNPRESAFHLKQFNKLKDQGSFNLYNQERIITKSPQRNSLPLLGRDKDGNVWIPDPDTGPGTVGPLYREK